jgi:AbrB family looped-hinge helix DNA binding protein
MATSTVTSKGQTTIPKEIRDHLKLRPGNRLDFIVEADGRVVLRPAQYDIRELHGLLQRQGQKRLSVDDMKRVIRDRHGRGR